MRRSCWTYGDKKGMEREKLIRGAMPGKIKKVTKEGPTRDALKEVLKRGVNVKENRIKKKSEVQKVEERKHMKKI